MQVPAIHAEQLRQSYDEEENYYNDEVNDHDHHCQDNSVNMMVLVRLVMIKSFLKTEGLSK